MAGNWGSFIGHGGPRQMDFRDSDSDGIDDRDQLAPWQRNTVAQTHSIPVIPYGSTESQLDPRGNAQNFLGGFVNQLKDMWNNRGGGGYRSDSDTPGDFYTEFVPHPQTGELVHPGVVDQWNRDQDLKFKNHF